jgi:hypothetical protein
VPTRQNIDVRTKIVAVLLPLCLLLGVSAASAQRQPRRDPRQQPTRPAGPPPTLIAPPEKRLAPGSMATDLGCAGFIEHEPSAPVGIQVVGGEQEQEQRIFSEGDYIFVDGGVQQGLTAGQEFAVVRPRGRFTSKFTAKRGTLGVYTQEVGRLRLTEVRGQVSIAVVTGACETILLGDVLRPLPTATTVATTGLSALNERADTPFNRFSDPTGKQEGRIVLARDAREMLTRNHVVYIDLGREDNLKAGDRLNIFRPAGTGNITRLRDEEMTDNTHDGFESERFRGGKFSVKAQRAKDPNGTDFNDQHPVNTPEIKRRRPAVPRKVIGEMVVLSVEARTATAIITRVTQEVHTGDFVEVR